MRYSYKNFRALLKVFGQNSVSCIYLGMQPYAVAGNAEAGRVLASRGGRLGWRFDHARLTQEDKLEIIYTSLKRMWILFAIYVCMILIAALSLHPLKPYETQKITPLPMTKGDVIIDENNRFITFTNTDESGVSFSYLVYESGKLISQSFEAINYGEEFELQLYTLLEDGTHHLKINTLCYRDGELFDTLVQEMDILVMHTKEQLK